MSWLQNAWYMGAWAEEVGTNGLSRQIADKPIYFFRLSNGQIGALLDRCPHRFAPLSKGERDGDTVVCGYHGLAFSAEGKCVRNPFSDRIPAGSDIPAFDTAEKDGIVWLWVVLQGQLSLRLFRILALYPTRRIAGLCEDTL